MAKVDQFYNLHGCNGVINSPSFIQYIFCYVYRFFHFIVLPNGDQSPALAIIPHLMPYFQGIIMKTGFDYGEPL